MVELRNKSGHKFRTIIGAVRTYHFPGGEEYVIDQPRFLHVSDSGGHRILDSEGVGHYVPAGWLAVSWTVAADEPHFTI